MFQRDGTRPGIRVEPAYGNDRNQIPGVQNVVQTDYVAWPL